MLVYYVYLPRFITPSATYLVYGPLDRSHEAYQLSQVLIWIFKYPNLAFARKNPILAIQDVLLANQEVSWCIKIDINESRIIPWIKKYSCYIKIAFGCSFRSRTRELNFICKKQLVGQENKMKERDWEREKERRNDTSLVSH